MPIAILQPILLTAEFNLIYGILGGAASMIGPVVQETTGKRDAIPQANILERNANILSRVNAYLPHNTRQDDEVGPCGVPMYNFDQCNAALADVTIRTSIPAEGVAHFQNVPPECMTLATAIGGACLGEGYQQVTPCGTACLRYTGLTQDGFRQLREGLSGSVAE